MLRKINTVITVNDFGYGSYSITDHELLELIPVIRTTTSGYTGTLAIASRKHFHHDVNSTYP
jgi:hypothetical protein